MKQIHLMLTLAFLLTACGGSSGSTPAAATGEQEVKYQVIGDDLQALKDDFNANEGRVRLLFLSGPTCGICLRGMADLNDAFLAASQADDRLVTFVVHVPTMGAEEHHAADSIALLEGPRIHHYWEESGIIGQHFTEVMDVDIYVWDFWAIYGPEARWDGTLPPKPGYYEHQLGVTTSRYRAFSKERVLDAERFAEKTSEYLEMVDSTQFARQAIPTQDNVDLLADGTDIAYVGQPRNIAVRQHIMGRGGYKNLKRVRSVTASGSLQADDTEYAFTAVARRPNELRRELTLGSRSSVAEFSAGTALIDTSIDRGLPHATEIALLMSFEFDGLFVEWPDKGHEVKMDGMRKFGDVLAWRLQLRQKNGPLWNMYVDSHSDDLVEIELLEKDGVQLRIRQSDFRDVSGVRFAHNIEYSLGNGELLARELIDTIDVELDAFDIDAEEVTH